MRRSEGLVVTLVLLSQSIVACGPTVEVCDDAACEAEGSIASSMPADGGGSTSTEGPAAPLTTTTTSTTTSGPGDDTGAVLEGSSSTSDTTGDPGVVVGVGDPSACLGGGNVLVFDGDADDWVHPGTAIITQAQWPATLPGDAALDTIQLYLTPTDRAQGLWWTVWLRTTEVPAPLATGLYEDTMRVPFESPGHPGLDVTGDGRGCNTSAGAFEIHTLDVDAEGLARLTVSFEQHCEVGPSALRGCVHWERP